MFSNKVFTLTFGCQSENHIGMQKNGIISENGFNIKQLKHIQNLFEKKIILVNYIISNEIKFKFR